MPVTPSATTGSSAAITLGPGVPAANTMTLDASSNPISGECLFRVPDHLPDAPLGIGATEETTKNA